MPKPTIRVCYQGECKGCKKDLQHTREMKPILKDDKERVRCGDCRQINLIPEAQTKEKSTL